MNKIYALVFFFLPLFILAQTRINNTIIDAKTKQVLTYCNVYNNTLGNGVISNADGQFSIEINSLNDIISFSFLSYETRNITAKEINQYHTISLKQKQYQLQEIEIHSDNDYLYEALVNCRKMLKKSKREQISKAFFILNTSTNQQPLEILECYYNAYQKAGKLDDLYQKNGRFALLPLDSRIFLNLSTTRVLHMINLQKENELLPSIILQFNKRDMKKRYRVKLEYSDSSLYKISFSSLENKNNLFAGEIWLNKNTYYIKKISLNVQNTTKHPFVALGGDSLRNISLQISYTFSENDKAIKIKHMEFNMQMNYNSQRVASIDNKPQKLKRDLEISTILYFYDFGNPFLLPYFDYDNNYRDYRKISIIPYNKTFWENRKLLLTKEQKDNIALMKDDGLFINYDQNNYGKNFMKKESKESNLHSNGFWEHLSHLFWSPEERITFNDIFIIQQNPPSHPYSGFTSDQYDFKVQIFLDINPINGVYNCQSYTILDLTKTFYYLETNEYSNAFVNIYFDICEIERQKMEKQLLIHNKSLDQINSIYKQTLLDIAEITYTYKKEVQAGKNTLMLKKWNNYVLNELGIDNLSASQH
ncbi:MAG: hypothetical protein B7C24_12815 [Bacteroidetes bacterium 4572_77]|nr:MAG: hypothetical protein B7C24_12815 [Bacteroidetes bacterium 4572_77]